MRIITGSLKGRTLSLPKSSTARPTSDRVRGALFNILFNQLPGASMLDVFTGCGAVALEGISRGLGHVVMCDSDRKNISEITNSVENFDLDPDKYELVCMDFRRLLNRELKNSSIYDIIFLDPPYKSGYYEDVIKAANDLLTPDGVLIAEHSTQEKLKDAYGNMKQYDQRRYGSTKLSFYRKDTI